MKKLYRTISLVLCTLILSNTFNICYATPDTSSSTVIENNKSESSEVSTSSDTKISSNTSSDSSNTSSDETISDETSSDKSTSSEQEMSDEVIDEVDGLDINSIRMEDEVNLACNWTKGFDENIHYDICTNHNDTGYYNNHVHKDGKANIANHNMQTVNSPNCLTDGMEQCGCGFTRVLPRLGHDFDVSKGYFNNGMHAVCSVWCNRCGAKKDYQGCTFYWLQTPTTSRAGILKCSRCGFTLTTSKGMCTLPSYCPSGGQHEFAGTVQAGTTDGNGGFTGNEFEHTQTHCALRCTKCNQVVPILKHSFDGPCKICRWRPMSIESEQVVAKNGNDYIVRVKFSDSSSISSVTGAYVWTTKGYGSDVCNKVTSINKIGDNLFEYTFNHSKLMDYKDQTLSFYYVNSSVFGNATMYGKKNQVYLDMEPPTIVDSKVIPQISSSAWSNYGMIDITCQDEIGNVSMAIYNKDTNEVIEDFVRMNKAGNQYNHKYYIRDTYSNGLNVIIKLQDSNGNISSTELRLGRIDNSAPILKYTVDKTSETKGDIKISCEVSDELSGVSRTYLPDGTIETLKKFDYLVKTNGRYPFKVVDRIGNIRTVFIDVGNIAIGNYLTINTSEFRLTSNGFENGKMTMSNNSDIPLKVRGVYIVAQDSEFTITKKRDMYRVDLSSEMGSKYFSMAIKVDDKEYWPEEISNMLITLQPFETKSFDIVGIAGKLYKESHTIPVTLDIEVQR